MPKFFIFCLFVGAALGAFGINVVNEPIKFFLIDIPIIMIGAAIFKD